MLSEAQGCLLCELEMLCRLLVAVKNGGLRAFSVTQPCVERGMIPPTLVITGHTQSTGKPTAFIPVRDPCITLMVAYLHTQAHINLCFIMGLGYILFSVINDSWHNCS